MPLNVGSRLGHYDVTALVKSETTSQELVEYVAAIEDSPFNRMFYVFHSGEAATDNEGVTVIGPEQLADLVMDVAPLPEREWTHGNVLPDRISIYQQPIVEDSDDDDDIIRNIGETVIPSSVTISVSARKRSKTRGG